MDLETSISESIDIPPNYAFGVSVGVTFSGDCEQDGQFDGKGIITDGQEQTCNTNNEVTIRD
ncbi:MAG: hypothetical protein DA328_09450 [Nitrososphaeraceae archaeon]|nr:hypothetical protein [Nitrososphaeraceae archaeon]